MQLISRKKSSTKDHYPSRRETRPTLLPRKEPAIADERAEGPLDRSELRGYDDRGFHTQEAFIGPRRLARCRRHADELRTRCRRSQKPWVVRHPQSGSVRAIYGVHRGDDELAGICRDASLASTAKQILGADVYIHQSRLHHAPRFGGGEMYWHSDFETWHVEDGMPAMRAINVSIGLTDSSPHNGPLLLIPGSHKIFVSCTGERSERHESESLLDPRHGIPRPATVARLVGESGIAASTGPAGGALFYDCNIMHAANGNITPWPKTRLVVTYNRVDNQLDAPYGGREPRPEFLAERTRIEPLSAHA